MSPLTARTVRTHRGGVLRILSACLVPIAACCLIGGVRVLFDVPHVFFLGALLAVPTALRFQLARPKAGVVVRTVPGGLEVGSRPVPYEDVDAAYESAPSIVTLLLRDKTRIELDVADRAPETVLQDLGFDLENRVQRAPLRASMGPFTLGFLTFVTTIFAFERALDSYRLVGLAAAFALSIVTTAAVVMLFGYPRLVIGTDGLRFESGLRKRFIPFSRIEAVRVTEVVRDPRSGAVTTNGQGITLDLRDEGHLLLPTVGQSDAQVEALARRIEAGCRAFSAHGARGVHVLERGARTVVDWRRDLESLLARDTGFREQPLDATELERELRDVSAPADRRIGAALALRVKAPDAAERIRGVADTCADDDMRIALEAVCGDTLDDDVVDRAERQLRAR